MITDEERREVAVKIREIHRDVMCIPFYAAVQQALSEIIPHGADYCLALADLIDRPTCRLELTAVETHGNTEVRIYECSECGRTCEEIYGKYERCPHRGAEVIEDGH